MRAGEFFGIKAGVHCTLYKHKVYNANAYAAIVDCAEIEWNKLFNTFIFIVDIAIVVVVVIGVVVVAIVIVLVEEWVL